MRSEVGNRVTASRSEPWRVVPSKCRRKGGGLGVGEAGVFGERGEKGGSQWGGARCIGKDQLVFVEGCDVYGWPRTLCTGLFILDLNFGTELIMNER